MSAVFVITCLPGAFSRIVAGVTFGGMQFGLLGPLAVWMEGHEVPLGAPKQRALLALLLLRANQVVPTARLIDELWGERPPARAVKTVQVYVSQLRKLLGEGVIETRSGGYLVRVDAGALDAALHFSDRVRAASARSAIGWPATSTTPRWWIGWSSGCASSGSSTMPRSRRTGSSNGRPTARAAHVSAPCPETAVPPQPAAGVSASNARAPPFAHRPAMPTLR